MAWAGRRGTSLTPNASDLHRQWLELVDIEGPFLAIPPLKRVWPEGMPQLSDARKAVLSDARKDFEPDWERYDRSPGSDTALDTYRSARDRWVETVLRDVAGVLLCVHLAAQVHGHPDEHDHAEGRGDDPDGD